MTTYAHITTDGTIDQVCALPALWLGPTRWHDWRGDPETWSTQPADVGWLPVVESPRPDDTDTDTHEPTYAVDGATVVQTWTARPWTAEELAAQAEQAAYEAQQATDRAILDATAALMADAHTDGEPWTQPTGAANAYPLDAIVTDAGKTWISLIPANVWRPGVSGWREQVAEGYPVWVQPSGPADAYNVGDPVRFDGSNYESTINGNVWSPTAYPAGWRKL